MRTSSRRVLAAGAVLSMGFALAFCAPSGAETIGDGMIEAGTTLRDLAAASATAQGDGGAGASSEPTPDTAAPATSSSRSCARWEYSVWVPCDGSARYPTVCAVPEGWEPFAVDRETVVSIRRCAD